MQKNSSLRTFYSSATRLWNKTEPPLRDTLSQKRFLRDSKGNKVQCLRKIRPVTPLELWNNAENKRNTNKRTPIQGEKYTSHPSFLAASPHAARPSRVLAFYSVQRKIRACSQSNLDDAFSRSRSGQTYIKDEAVRNWLFEYHRV